MTKLLIPEQPLMVLPILAERIGLNEAIVVQQIHYWLITSPTERDGKKWIYNSYKEWHEQFPFWSVNTIGRIFRKLEDMKLITSKQMAVSGYDRTKWYTLNYQNGLLDDTKMVHSTIPEEGTLHYTETTSENTTETDSVVSEMVLDKWNELFPNKPQPRINNKTIRSKIKTRWEDAWFRENWIEAMIRASQSSHLQEKSWFNFNYFIRSETTVQNCYDRWMSWKDGNNAKANKQSNRSEQMEIYRRIEDGEDVPPTERDRELQEKGLL